MSVCGRYEIMISVLLDGELGEPEKAELSAHIAGCEHCAAMAAAFAASSGALEEGLEEPPVGLHGAIMEKVGAAAKVKRSQTRFMRLRPIIAAAACVAVVVVTLFAANRGLRGAQNAGADSGSTESYDAAPEAPVYAGGTGGSVPVNGAVADTAGENGGAEPMEAPDPAPAGAAMDNAAPSETRSANDAAATEEAVAESKATAGDEAVLADRDDLAEPESEADVPAGLPELEVEVVAAGEGSFTAAVVADPSGNFAPGALLAILSDEAVSPGTRVTVYYSAVDAESVTAEEIVISE